MAFYVVTLLLSLSTLPFLMGLAFGLPFELNAPIALAIGGFGVFWILIRTKGFIENSFRSPLHPIPSMDAVFSEALFEVGKMEPEVGGLTLKGFAVPEFFQVRDPSAWAIVYRLPGTSGTVVFSQGFLTRLTGSELREVLRKTAERLVEPKIMVNTLGIALGCRLLSRFNATEWRRFMTEGSYRPSDRNSGPVSAERLSGEAISFMVRFALWGLVRKLVRLKSRQFEVELNPELYQASRVTGSALPLPMREIHLFHPWPSDRSDLLSGEL